MARPQSKGLKYISLDVSFLQDRKIRRLIRRNGEKAPLVYVALLCAIYAEGYYIGWDDDMALDLADITRMDESYIKDVIEGCFEVSLLSREMFDEHRILTSHGIQVQYQSICEQCRRKAIVSEYSLIVSSEETPRNEHEHDVSSEETPRNEQSECIPAEKDVRNATNKNKENRKERNYYSSLSSLPSDEEKQQQEIVFEFFMRNWAQPRKEFFDKFLPFNNTGKRRWASMDAEARKAAVKLWKQTPPQKPRFSDKFLTFWYHLFRYVQYNYNYYDILWDMLDDSLTCIENGNRLTLTTSRRLMDFLEACKVSYFDIAQEYYEKINYRIINE